MANTENNMSNPTFAINGFGRIGRTSLRIWWQHYRQQLDLVAINTSGSMPLKGWTHLLKYDTNYGPFKPKIEFQQQQSNQEVTDDNPVLGFLQIEDKRIPVLAQRDPSQLPWEQYQVQLVLEATGVFRSEKLAKQHLQAGASKVLLSAPGKGGNISTSVLGVNDFDPQAEIFSNASCTTNCAAPVAKIVLDEFGIESGLLTTIHSYTDSQNLLDNSTHKDLRRARTAAENLIPTTTGAAKATAQIIPQLQGKFDGMAVRTPTPVGSVVDMVFQVEQAVTAKQVKHTFQQAADSDHWSGILAVNTEPIVSSDIIGRPESSIVDLDLTQVMPSNLVKIISWYDNEWGYCSRLMDQLLVIAGFDNGFNDTDK
jgi:glyceraldehyde 3-phosphate dehydrogenase